MRDWSKKVGGKRERLYVWNYFCWPAFWTEAPLFFPHNLQKWLQDTYAISSGEFVCPGGNPPPRSGFVGNGSLNDGVMLAGPQRVW